MKRMTPQKRVVFFLLQPVRSPRTFLVPAGHVAGWRLAQRLRLGALKRDYFLRHDKIDELTGEAFQAYSLVFSTGAGSSSPSPSPPSSSVKPKSDVTDWRTREALFCFSSCD
jgi:hypothetical protein